MWLTKKKLIFVDERFRVVNEKKINIRDNERFRVVNEKIVVDYFYITNQYNFFVMTSDSVLLEAICQISS